MLRIVPAYIDTQGEWRNSWNNDGITETPTHYFHPVLVPKDPPAKTNKQQTT